MLYKTQFDNTQVWIKNSGEVEIKDMETKKVLLTFQISDYRTREAQEALMDDGFESVGEVIAKVEAANAIDALYGCCKQYWLFGMSDKQNALSIKMGDNSLLFGWTRYGLNSGFCCATVSNEAEDKCDTYNFDFYDSKVLIEVLQAVSSYERTKNDEKIIDTLKKHSKEINSDTISGFLDKFKKTLESTRA